MKTINALLDIPEKGILSDAVSQLIPELNVRKKSRILIVACSVKIHFPWEKSCERYRKAISEAEKAVGDLPIEIVSTDEPFEDPFLLIELAEREKAKGLAGIIFLHVAFTAGEIGSQFGRWLIDNPIPVLSWGWPEMGNRGRNEANNVTCQNFILNMWRQLGVKYTWVHAGINEEAHPMLERFYRASSARYSMLHGKVLHAGGSRVTAFYDGEVDEISVMKHFGVQFDRIDLEAVFQHAQKFSDADLNMLKNTLVSHPSCGKVDLPDEQIIQTYRFGLGMLDMAAENGYIGACVKSWPDLFDCYGCAIDGSVSMMNDFGFCVAEEGEMNGLLSSLALYYVSDSKAVPTMMDLSILDRGKNQLGIWHCGASPTRLMKPGTKFDATKHSILENGNPETAVGLMLEFLFANGPITLLRYQSPKAEQYFSFEGDFIDTEQAYRGTYGSMKPKGDENIMQIIGTIFDKGLDHHWSLGYGHWQDEIKLLNYFLGIDEISLRESQEKYGYGVTV